MKAKFDVAVWGQDIDTVKDICIECERLGYNAFYYGEGLGPECFTTLAHLTGITEKIRLGPGISFLSYRHPVLLGKIAATLDVLSGGRFELRVGAGGVPGYGIERPPPEVRVSQMAEGLQIVKMLWKKGKATFDGRFYQVENAVCDPLPVQRSHPPITIAAKGTKMLEVTALHADIWEGYFPPEVYASKTALLDKQCLSLHRNPSDLERSLMLRVFIGRNNDDAKDSMRRYITRRGISEERLERSRGRDAVGEASQCAEKFLEYLHLGVNRFTLLVGDAEKLESLRLFSDKVIPMLS